MRPDDSVSPGGEISVRRRVIGYPMTPEAGDRADRVVPASTPNTIPSPEPDEQTASVFFVGNATTLIRYAGFCILTDPNFLHRGERVALGYGLRSKRRTEPALSIDQLPAVDLVVLSHFHGDHFDRRVQRDLDKRLPIVSTGHAVRALRRRGFTDTRALDTWEAQTVRKGSAFLRVTATPAKHAPQPLGALLPPVMGTVLEFGDGTDVALRLYITGDTLTHDRLEEIPRRYPNIDLALIHLGGTRILGVLATMDAEQGVEALKLIRPATAIPIHYNDYTVFTSSLDDFRAAVDAAHLDTQVRYLAHGESYEFPPTLANGN